MVVTVRYYGHETGMEGEEIYHFSDDNSEDYARQMAEIMFFMSNRDSTSIEIIGIRIDYY